MGIMDNEGHDPQGFGNTPRRSDANEFADTRAELVRLRSYRDGLVVINRRMETEVERLRAENLWIRNQTGPEIERLRAALTKIAKMKPEPIADGFVHGPALLLSNCQREAHDALKSRHEQKSDPA